MFRRFNGNIAFKLLNLSRMRFGTDQIAIKQNITRLNEYLNAIINKFDKGNINLDSLKKFLKLEEISSDFINKKIFESDELKSKIRKIIFYNTSLEENLSFTKFCYYDLQLEKNHHIFQTLLLNNIIVTNYKAYNRDNLDIVKKEQEKERYFLMNEEELMNYKIKYKGYQQIMLKSYPFFTFNILTVEPLVLKHDNCIGHYQQMNRELFFNDNFKKYDLIQNIIFLNVFPFLSIKVEDCEFFKYVIDEFKIKYKNYQNFNDFIFLFYFMENFRYSFDLKFKVDFFKLFKKKLIELFKTVIEIEKNPLSEISDKGTEIEWRFDDLILLMEFYHEDTKFINLFEYILHVKSSTKICPLINLVKLVNLYRNVSKEKKINSFLANFIAFHSTEHLKRFISISDFENYILIIYCTLCDESDTYEGSEVYSEFFEEFKNCVFYSKFYDSNHFNISVDVLKIIKQYNRFTKKYTDNSFDNYLTQSIDFLSVITTI